MCGIVGYAGERQAAPILLQGLKDLEYRGYDSAGIAVFEDGVIRIAKREGKLGRLEEALSADGELSGTVGIGHTRWATHGEPSDRNAHPHRGRTGEIAIVHNGIVENYAELMRELDEAGVRRISETDSETIAHLVEREMDGGADLAEAVRRTARRLVGSQAMLAMSSREPGVLVAVRLGNAGGIVLGHGDGETMVSSDLTSILPHTQTVSFLAAGEAVRATSTTVELTDIDGERRELERQRVAFDPLSALKGQYAHFLQKEMMEQPEALSDTIQSLVSISPPALRLDALGAARARLGEVDRVVLLGMGTSGHAARLGGHAIETFARVPVTTEDPSEFRYRNPVIDERTLVVSVSQSGETVDVLETMAVAKEQGALQITVCNTPGAQTTRVAEGTIYTRCGVERSVASTKTLTASVVALYCLGLEMGLARGTIAPVEVAERIVELAGLPDAVGGMLARQEEYREAAAWLGPIHHMLYLGRGTGFVVAMEGALKMKELSYVHAEAYAAGEMKHGPIALIDETCPVVAVATGHAMPAKMESNIQQVRSRGGRVLAVVTEGNEQLASLCDRVVTTPRAPALLEPLLAVVPLQAMAYHTAVRRGCDVDQPRNLAKTVTVE